MKKLTTIFAALALFVSASASASAFAASDRPVSISELPAVSQQFITKYFAGTEVSYAKIDDGIWDKSYDVIFANGCKVEFSKNGEWKEVDCKRSEVPAGIVPGALSSYAAKHHAGRKIVSIDRDKRDYELKLDNGLELKFDLKFNLIEIDD